MSALVLIALLSLAVGAVTAAATALRSASRFWLRQLADAALPGGTPDGMSGADRSQRLSVAAGTAIAGAAFTLGAVLVFRGDAPGIYRDLTLAAAALLLLGQVLPRLVARRWAVTLLPALTPLLRALHVMLGPILSFSGRLAARVPEAARSGTEPEMDSLEDILRDAEAEGVGAADESEIISGVAEFGDKRVRDVMTPRERVVSVLASASPAEVASAVVQSNYTRIPVLSDGGDHVTGVLHAFDVLATPSNPLATLRQAEVAAPEEPCSAVMRRMLRDHRHLGAVMDGGRLVGIVTLEDLVEELVGDIRDEHDEPGLANG